jgi:hypothetical protein
MIHPHYYDYIYQNILCYKYTIQIFTQASWHIQLFTSFLCADTKVVVPPYPYSINEDHHVILYVAPAENMLGRVPFQ